MSMAKFDVLDKAKIGRDLYIFGCRYRDSGRKFVVLVKTDGKGDIIRLATFDGGYDGKQRGTEAGDGEVQQGALQVHIAEVQHEQ